MSTHFVILGATGDLTARYLVPALASLRAQQLVEFSSSILCVGYEAWDQDHFRTHIRAALEKFAPAVSPEVRAATVASLEYHQADVTKPAELAAALGRHTEPMAVYLALPPTITAQVLQGLAAIKLPPESRIVIEKPFGHNLASAEALNDLLRPTFKEKLVFRIDHFLGKQTAQTSSASGSPTGSSSRSGTATTSTRSRSPGTNPSRSKAAPATTTRLAP